jgi:hypothetical protein
VNRKPDPARIEAILKAFEQRLREIDAEYAGKLRMMISAARDRRLAELRDNLNTKPN